MQQSSKKTKQSHLQTVREEEEGKGDLLEAQQLARSSTKETHEQLKQSMLGGKAALNQSQLQQQQQNLKITTQEKDKIAQDWGF